MTKENSISMNPVDFEIIRHKLMAITEEQRITFQSVSGSPVVTEASDYYTGLFLADGTIATMGYKVATQGGPMTFAIESLLEFFPQEELRPGDVFLANDPYRAAVHQNDIQVLAPLFHEGQLVAWAGFGAHEVDVGGMDFASWCPQAYSVYQEGVRIPGIKIVDGGKIREDIWRFLLELTRLPHFLDLDLRGMLAAAHVSARRIADLMARYGVDVVQETMREMVTRSEERLRERLLGMADGRFYAVDYLEHDGHEDVLYKISVTVVKKGDSLSLDLTDCSDQAPGFINSTRAGVRGGVVGALFPSLGYDIPWNEGLLRPVAIQTRSGSICDARFPAPVGAATVEAVWVIKNVVSAALAKLKACSQGMERETQAVSLGTMATINLGGTDQYGQRFGMHLLDPLLGGFGAYTDEDGFDVGGSYSTAVPNVANVESNESLSPMLYLHRRLEADTGGAGAWRGGLAAGMAFTAHGVKATDALIMTHGMEVPNSSGLFGGFPGSCVDQRLLRDSDLEIRQRQGTAPTDIEELKGHEQPLGPKPGMFTLRPGDVFETLWQGGGGVGDPLDRDPDRVAADLLSGHCTLQAAFAVYGVALGPEGRLDVAATGKLRDALRQQRLADSESPRDPHGGGVERVLKHLGGRLNLALCHQERWFACACGRPLSPCGESWRSGAARAIVPKTAWPPYIRLHRELELRQYICPACGGLLSVDVMESSAEDLHDMEIW